MKPANFGINGGWGGNRTTKQIVSKFDIDFNTASANAALGADSSWGLVGGLNGWSAPDWKLYESGTPNVFIGFYTLPAGELKFRKNNDWGINYGDNGANGTLDDGGSNIVVEAGTYKVTMNFGNLTYKIEKDPRGMFFTEGQNLEIETVGSFSDGYAITKFKNVDRNGKPGSDTGGTFTDTDFPLFRLADVYLMYAEATLRGGGGNESTAIVYINKLRKRVYGVDNTVTSISLDFILDERARELYWEGHRRTDLIRFGKFSNSSYLWAWKGGSKEGVSTSGHLDLYPIPATDMNANPNLTQNPGY